MTLAIAADYPGYLELFERDDARIKCERLVREAQELDKSGDERRSWDTMLDHVRAQHPLKLWGRSKAMKDIFDRYKPQVRRAYGTIDNCIAERLGWRDDNMPSDAPSHFRANIRASLFDITLNEFPKPHPEGVTQFILWTRVPILDPSLCATDEERQDVSTRGLMGITGRPGDETAGIGPNASSEVRKFIACRWPDAETIFFLNAVENQSVLGIPHVQIMVKES